MKNNCKNVFLPNKKRLWVLSRDFAVFLPKPWKLKISFERPLIPFKGSSRPLKHGQVSGVLPHRHLACSDPSVGSGDRVPAQGA